MAETDLRIDCAEHRDATPDVANANWSTFVRAVANKN